MKYLNQAITIKELRNLAKSSFGNMVKAVVDVNLKTMVVDAELHADQEAYLIKKGSSQQNLWGINLYPDLFDEPDFIEFDSMINLRPNQNNLTRSVEDKDIQLQIRSIVTALVKDETS
jgi:hypothetical protein